jgi:signal transduction histidine kinase
VKQRPTSLAARAAWAAFLSAGLAAAVAAIAASWFANAVVLRATDQHLLAAATELARELDDSRGARSIEDVVRDEQAEATSTGIRFAIYGAGGKHLAGDTNVRAVAEPCALAADLRICSVSAKSGVHVVAATLREASAPLLVLAALAAATLAGCLAWGIARVLGRRAVAPLVRLQTRIAGLPLETASRAAMPAGGLGPNEGVTEVDDLRNATMLLLTRMFDAVERSSQFAANAAHELRTPLTALRAELELMAENDGEEIARPEASTSRESVRTALRKVIQLQSLMERLLVLATPKRNDHEELEIVSLRDVIDDAVANLAEGDRSRLTIADDEDVFVRGDLASLGIVVSNGLSNALKFGRHAVLELGVENEHAVVAIDDDGPGIPEAERTIVFEPFARGSGRTRAPGHGLGLALVAHVARCHGGDARFAVSRHAPTGARLEVRFRRVVAGESSAEQT